MWEYYDHQCRGKGVLSLWLLLSIAVLPFLFSSCTSFQDRYSHYEMLEEEGWREGNELFFSIPPLSPEKKYKVELALRLSRNLRYEELPIGVLVETPGRTFDKKILKVPTSTDILHLGGYNYFEVLCPLGEVTFGEKGVYSYSVRHLSTDSVLQGVLEVGLIVEPLGTK